MKTPLRRFAITTLRALSRPHERTHRFVERALEADQTPLLCEPGAEAVVVLAPHADDEVIGCGGTIALHVKAGAKVAVIFLADGDRGDAAHRRGEARDAAHVLGIEATQCLGGKDSALAADAKLVPRLRALLLDARPEVVYLPWFLERHPDHRAVSPLLLEAMKNTGLKFECRGYEVWTALLPNRLVRIDATVALKTQALECYASQLAQMDFAHIALGLNAYRSSAAPAAGCRYIEAFHALPLAEYGRRYREFLSYE